RAPSPAMSAPREKYFLRRKQHLEKIAIFFTLTNFRAARSVRARAPALPVMRSLVFEMETLPTTVPVAVLICKRDACASSPQARRLDAADQNGPLIGKS